MKLFNKYIAPLLPPAAFDWVCCWRKAYICSCRERCPRRSGPLCLLAAQLGTAACKGRRSGGKLSLSLLLKNKHVFSCRPDNAGDPAGRRQRWAVPPVLDGNNRLQPAIFALLNCLYHCLPSIPRPVSGVLSHHLLLIRAAALSFYVLRFIFLLLIAFL